jgi:hypothetical protein
MTFTAAQIAAALGVKRQAVKWHLRGITPAGVKVVRGNEAEAWEFCQLPAELQKRLQAEAQKQNCRDAETLLARPRRQWSPPLTLDKICEADIQVATKLREALQPFLIRQHDGRAKGAEFESAGLLEYRRVFGNAITARYWRELFARAIQRDNGFEDWNHLALYLPACPRAKSAPAAVVSEALAEDFAELESFIVALSNPLEPSKDERAGLWKLALVKFDELIRASQPEKTAGLRVRDFLWSRARWLARSRDALRKAFELRLANGIEDGRKTNGNRPEYPAADIRRVRHSAVLKNGGRIDAAWREEYPRLSDFTRQRHPNSRRCPPVFYRLVNREKVNTLKARLDGKRALRRMIGGVKRNAENVPTMARWAADDWTSNIEVYFTNRDGSISLIQPQIITVMDFASRKWVGWAMSADKGPNARLVCAALMDAFKRHDVPRQLWLENGWVFGRALDINGKEDAQGRTVVAGLAQYGCTVHHFDKMSPSSKGELEKSFDLFQRLMERHPGYAGRLQMLDASEDFKREQRLIRSGKVPASKDRYSLAEFEVVIHRLVEQYNATPQFGHLNGLCPNEAFELMRDKSDPPIKFDRRLHWYFANTRNRVRVTAGGVAFSRYGRKIRVRGGELPRHIGEELWALVDREDDSMVTFMSLDFRQIFTVETCVNVPADISRVATGAGVLAAERAKIGAHARAVEDEFKALQSEFGNPRRDLLAQFRNETAALNGVSDTTTRRVILNSRLEQAGPNIEAQRQAIKSKRRQNTANKSKASRLGIPATMIGHDARSRRAIELAEEAAREANRLEATEEIEP